MSYILDALKRAEAERNGAAATRAALPASLVAAPPAGRTGRALRWLIPLLAGTLIGSFLLQRPWEKTEVDTNTAQAKSAALQEPAVRPLAAAAPVAAIEKPAPVIIPPPVASAPSAAPASSPKPVQTASVAEAPRPVLAPAPAQIPAPISAPISASIPAPKQHALGTLRDLPHTVQREIPPLVIGGYLYSPIAADRTVLINKRLLHEGDEVAPGLILERLMADGMVLSYRGHRFRNSY